MESTELDKKQYARKLEKHREWSRLNRDKINASLRAERKINPEKFRERDKKRHERNREARNKRQRDYNSRNRDKAAASKRSRNYGLSPEEFEHKKVKQNNCCAVCLSVFITTPFVDHNHATKKVRDLLCVYCNSLLGYAKDNTEILESAIQYLRKHGE
jgi:hypothetical protein